MTSQLKQPRYLKKLTIRSGILIPLCTVNGVPSLLYNLRSSTLRAHRGEVCFPGGRKDANETVQQTALRESWEEIGLDPNAVDILGILPGAPDRTMKSLTVGVVGFLGEFNELELTINKDEVAHLFTVPIETLLSDEVAKRQYFRVGNQPSKSDYEMPVYLTESHVGHRVWGFTAIQTNLTLSILLPDRVELLIPRFIK